MLYFFGGQFLVGVFKESLVYLEVDGVFKSVNGSVVEEVLCKEVQSFCCVVFEDGFLEKRCLGGVFFCIFDNN